MKVMQVVVVCCVAEIMYIQYEGGGVSVNLTTLCSNTVELVS